MEYILENEGEFYRLEKQATQKHYSLEEEFKHLKLTKNAKVLDAGCGSGLVSRYMVHQEPTIQIQAVDSSDIRIAQAKKNNPTQYNQIEFIKADLNKLPYEDNTFDFVVSRFVYEYLPDPIKTTKELYRVLKPGGRIYLIDLDGVFSNFWTIDDKFNEDLKNLIQQTNLDLDVGRKLPSFLDRSGFKEIRWNMTSHPFINGPEVAEEMMNNSERLNFATPKLNEIFKNIEEVNDFKKKYLGYMETPDRNVMFFNKFNVIGQK